MGFTQAIGKVGAAILYAIVRTLAAVGVRPNFLTLLGLLISALAATLFAAGQFRTAGLVMIVAGLLDMLDGRLARLTGQVTHFGAFFDSVVDRYSDLVVLMGLLVYYASINRFFYIVLTAVVMAGSVMVSYTRARAECLIPQCKVGFMERPERVVLLIIGALTNRMAPVLWVIAILSNLTVIHRIVYTHQQTRALKSNSLTSHLPPRNDLTPGQAG